MHGEQYIIKAEGLCKDFRASKKYPGIKGAVKSLFSREKVITEAVKDVSFSVAKGEMVGYIGSNGAGKSTTIKMMTGILTPTSGRCLVNGIEPYKHRQKNAAGIGVVFGQRTQLWWDLPVTESFSVLKGIYQVSDADFRKKMDYINDVLGVHEFQSQTVRTLSLGQRMRADLGAALIHSPPILYLDEPTIGLDVVVKENIRTAIRGMNDEFQTTVILTTHDMADIEELCGHIIIIDKGSIIYDGTLGGLKDEYGSATLLQMQVGNPQAAAGLPVCADLSLPEEKIGVRAVPGGIEVSFDKGAVTSARLLAYYMGKTDVRDMSVKETDITAIVKSIYRNGGM